MLFLHFLTNLNYFLFITDARDPEDIENEKGTSDEEKQRVK